jgi:hypothetical protein
LRNRAQNKTKEAARSARSGISGALYNTAWRIHFGRSAPDFEARGDIRWKTLALEDNLTFLRNARIGLHPTYVQPEGAGARSEDQAPPKQNTKQIEDLNGLGIIAWLLDEKEKKL